MSFNAFAQFKSQGKQTQALEDVIKDENLKQNLKHLKKKDSTTKLKALSAISEAIRKISLEEAVIFLTEWISYMKKLCLENNRKIRQYSFVILSSLIQLVKKENFSPHLKNLMGVWLIGIHDSDPEVSKEALKVFDSQFPKNKHDDVYMYCQDDILKYLRANFLFTAESLNETKIASEEEAEENYDRFLSASVTSLDDLISHLKQVDDEKFVDILTPQFFKFLNVKEYTCIKSATFKLVSTLCQKTKHLVEPHLAFISPIVIGCFGEKDPMVHLTMGEALLTFLKTFPESWKHVNPNKAIWPKLMTFLSFPVTSSPNITFQILLPFLAMLPYSVLESNEKSIQFFEKFFVNMWKGYLDFPQLQPLDSVAVVKNYLECLMFVILQSSRYIKEDDKVRMEFVTKLMESSYFPAIKCYVTNDVLEPSEYSKTLALTLTKFASRVEIKDLLNNMLISLEKSILSSLDEKVINKTIDLLNYVKSLPIIVSFVKNLMNTLVSRLKNRYHLIFLLNLSKSFGIDLILTDKDDIYKVTLPMFDLDFDSSMDWISLYLHRFPLGQDDIIDKLIAKNTSQIKLVAKLVTKSHPGFEKYMLQHFDKTTFQLIVEFLQRDVLSKDFVAPFQQACHQFLTSPNVSELTIFFEMITRWTGAKLPLENQVVLDLYKYYVESSSNLPSLASIHAISPLNANDFVDAFVNDIKKPSDMSSDSLYRLAKELEPICGVSLWNKTCFSSEMWSSFHELKKNLLILPLGDNIIVKVNNPESFLVYQRFVHLSCLVLQVEQAVKNWFLYEMLMANIVLNDFKTKKCLLSILGTIYPLHVVDALNFIKTQFSNEYVTKLFVKECLHLDEDFAQTCFKYVTSFPLDEILKNSEMTSFFVSILYEIQNNVKFDPYLVDLIGLTVSIVQEYIFELSNQKIEANHPRMINSLRLLSVLTILYSKMNDDSIQISNLLDCFRDVYVLSKHPSLDPILSHLFERIEYKDSFVETFGSQMVNRVITQFKKTRNIKESNILTNLALWVVSFASSDCEWIEFLHVLQEEPIMEQLVDPISKRYASRVKDHQILFSLMIDTSSRKLATFCKHQLNQNFELIPKIIESLSNTVDSFAHLLLWDLILQFYHFGDFEQKQVIFTCIKESHLERSLLNFVMDLNLDHFNPKMDDSLPKEEYLSGILFHFVKSFPSLVRFWYNEMESKRNRDLIDKWFEIVSPRVIQSQLKAISNNSTQFPSNVNVRIQNSTILTAYEKDEVKLEMQLVIPPNYPLKSVEIASKKKMGNTEMQLYKKWILNMTTVLFTTEGSIWDSILLWKNNLDKHFDGVEPCPICYSIVHAQNHALPKVACKTCKNKFHSQCLYKWFSTSGNNTCPMCRGINTFGF